MYLKVRTIYDYGHSFKNLDQCNHAIFKGKDTWSKFDRKLNARDGDRQSCTYNRHREAEQRRIERAARDRLAIADVRVQVRGNVRYAGSPFLALLIE